MEERERWMKPAGRRYWHLCSMSVPELPGTPLVPELGPAAWSWFMIVRVRSAGRFRVSPACVIRRSWLQWFWAREPLAAHQALA
eukprot:1778020-Prymnesium_polylepis.2